MAAPLVGAFARVRIGELSRRTGVSVDVLRVWERRYGVLVPERTPGGQRLYTPADEQRIRHMRALLGDGLSAREAARAVAAAAPAPAPAGAGTFARPLAEALDGLDAAGAHAALDQLFADHGAEAALRDVVLPYLHDVGERWASGEITVAHEHFVSRLLHGRLLGAARGWDSGTGPRALLACPPGEEHDLPLIAFGIALRSQGWRITYLGASTPIPSMVGLIDRVDYRAVVLAATTPARLIDSADQIRDLAGRVPVAVGGAGATERVADAIGARALEGDPVSAAAELARS